MTVDPGARAATLRARSSAGDTAIVSGVEASLPVTEAVSRSSTARARGPSAVTVSRPAAKSVRNAATSHFCETSSLWACCRAERSSVSSPVPEDVPGDVPGDALGDALGELLLAGPLLSVAP